MDDMLALYPGPFEKSGYKATVMSVSVMSYIENPDLGEAPFSDCDIMLHQLDVTVYNDCSIPFTIPYSSPAIRDTCGRSFLLGCGQVYKSCGLGIVTVNS